MIKPHPGPDLPLVTVLYAKNHKLKAYNVIIPHQGRPKTFTELHLVIDYLRSKNFGRCYIIQRDQCYRLGWSPLMPPWEGPEIS